MLVTWFCICFFRCFCVFLLRIFAGFAFLCALCGIIYQAQSLPVLFPALVRPSWLVMVVLVVAYHSLIVVVVEYPDRDKYSHDLLYVSSIATKSTEGGKQYLKWKGREA